LRRLGRLQRLEHLVRGDRIELAGRNRAELAGATAKARIAPGRVVPVALAVTLLREGDLLAIVAGSVDQAA
jgi:hypothetical protein